MKTDSKLKQDVENKIIAAFDRNADKLKAQRGLPPESPQWKTTSLSSPKELQRTRSLVGFGKDRLGRRGFSGQEALAGTLGGIQGNAADGDLELIEQRLDIFFGAKPTFSKPTSNASTLLVIWFEVISKLSFIVDFNRVGFPHRKSFCKQIVLDGL